MRRAVAAIVVGAGMATMSGCGQTAVAPSPLTIERPRIGAAPAGTNAAMYFDVVSDTADRLTGASTDVARISSIHRTDDAGTMIEVDAVDLPAGVVVRFEPFADHIMLEDLERDLSPGDRVPITLSFDDNPGATVEAIVVELADLADEP